jgi:tetratricopeptide (TPR) repeat protein
MQGKHNEAEALLHRGISIEKTALGPDHPSLVSSYNVLADLLDEQGREGEAKQYLERALEIAEKTLGREHPQSLWSRVSLALREAETNLQMEIGR